MDKIIRTSPYVHSGDSVQWLMIKAFIALCPSILIYSLYYGWGVWLQIGISISSALLIEAGMLKLRNIPIKYRLCDGSAVVSATLLALCLAPLTPWWINVAGVAFAIIVVKQLYGGLGCNLFNPAMAGYIFILLCFPDQANHWPDKTYGGLANTFTAIFIAPVDAVSGATPLSHLKSQLSMAAMVSEIYIDPMFSYFAEYGREWVNVGFLIGGISLVFARVIHWKTPVALLATLFILSTIGYWYNPDGHVSPLFYCFSGGAMLCAFFIATDPTSGATTPKGKIIFAAGCGALIYLIRAHGTFPDGTAFAVLIMNCLAPLIDHYSRPHISGHRKSGQT